MANDWTQKLNQIQQELGELIVAAVPENVGEWEALEKMTTAHRQIRSIDRTPLSQKRMDI